MSDNDPKAAMDAWLAAKSGLTLAEGELKAAVAGHEVAARCEREAWEKIAKLCGREPFPPAPPQAPPVQVFTPAAPLVSTGRLIQQDQPLTYRIPMYSGTAIFASNGFDTRARP